MQNGVIGKVEKPIAKSRLKTNKGGVNMKILKNLVLVALAIIIVSIIIQCQKAQRQSSVIPETLEKGQHKQVYYDYINYMNK